MSDRAILPPGFGKELGELKLEERPPELVIEENEPLPGPAQAVSVQAESQQPRSNKEENKEQETAKEIAELKKGIRAGVMKRIAEFYREDILPFIEQYDAKFDAAGKLGAAVHDLEKVISARGMILPQFEEALSTVEQRFATTFKLPTADQLPPIATPGSELWHMHIDGWAYADVSRPLEDALVQDLQPLWKILESIKSAWQAEIQRMFEEEHGWIKRKLMDWSEEKKIKDEIWSRYRVPRMIGYPGTGYLRGCSEITHLSKMLLEPFREKQK